MESTEASPDRFAEAALEVLQRGLADCQPRPFAVRLWDGTTWPPDTGAPAVFTLVIRRPGALRRMFLHASELSLGEAYVFGDLDVEGDLESVFELADYLTGLRPDAAERLRMARRLLSFPASEIPAAGRRAARLRGPFHSRERDRKAVNYHYDVSNDFYRLWLDRRMVYSAGYFGSPDDDLDAAQERKLEYVCRKLRLRPGEKLLDMGCGWGGLVLHAGRRHGVQALGITLSEPQAQEARRRIREAGLADRCRVEVRDYRELEGSAVFDKIASIGMVEHVGRTLAEYFGRAAALLRPGGAFLNHGIGYTRSRPETPGPSFVERYVFPDGDLLPLSATLQTAEESGFEVRDVESLREHYTLTLRHWVRRLEARFGEAVRTTDEVTCRIWRLYMSGAAYRFRTGRNNVYQVLLVKPDGGESRLPLTREDWYR